jgi:hypothetical protein
MQSFEEISQSNYIVSRLPLITKTAWRLNTKSVCSFGKHTLIYTTEISKLMNIIKKIRLRRIRWLRVNSLKCSRFYKSDDSKSGIFEEWDRVFDLFPAYTTKTLRRYTCKIRDTNIYISLFMPPTAHHFYIFIPYAPTRFGWQSQP